MAKTATLKGKRSKTPKKRSSKLADSHREVTFRSDAQEGSRVYVAGTFNGWDPEAHELTPDEGGGYSTTLRLPRGLHQYKLIINDVWCVDPGCEYSMPNPLGSSNSLLSVL